MHTLPEPAPRLVEIVNYSRVFSKPKMSNDSNATRQIDTDGSGHNKRLDRLKPSASKKRPLRTYSRVNTFPKSDDEPPRKKRIIQDEEPDKENIPSSPKLPELPTQPPVSVKKGSILAFFKPAATSSSVPGSMISSDQPSREDGDIVSSPPSSPPPIGTAVEKRKRRLGMRGIGRSSSPVRLEEDEDGPCDAKGGGDKRQVVAGEGINTMSRKDAPKRKATKATVQTTLALSLKDDPAYTICEDCEMLYNPLNEKDRKDHTRRHAAAVRKKAKMVASDEA